MSTTIKWHLGWRSMSPEDFTIANIRLAVAGIAAYVKNPVSAPSRARWPRPALSRERFVEVAAQVLDAAGVTPIVILMPRPRPPSPTRSKRSRPRCDQLYCSTIHRVQRHQFSTTTARRSP